MTLAILYHYSEANRCNKPFHSLIALKREVVGSAKDVLQ
jgi:hypothetical protein